MSEFKHIKTYNYQGGKPDSSHLIEIAYQLKRIADELVKLNKRLKTMGDG